VWSYPAYGRRSCGRGSAECRFAAEGQPEVVSGHRAEVRSALYLVDSRSDLRSDSLQGLTRQSVAIDRILANHTAYVLDVVARERIADRQPRHRDPVRR